MAKTRKSSLTPVVGMNRKQRRNLRRQLSSVDPGLEIVNRDAAGIDVGNQSHYVAVPPDRDAMAVQEFGC